MSASSESPAAAATVVRLSSECELTLSGAELFTVWRESSRHGRRTRATRLVQSIEEALIYSRLAGGRPLPSRKLSERSVRKEMLGWVEAHSEDQLTIILSSQQARSASNYVGAASSEYLLKPALLSRGELRELAARLSESSLSPERIPSLDEPEPGGGGELLSRAGV